MTDNPSRFIVAAVDDDQGILESLKKLLESADHRVRLFGSAAALLESGAVAEIDCLISDIGMRDMDGFQLTRVVRAARPDLPVILITGRADVLNRLPPAGSDHYCLFEKPFDADELLRAVHDAMHKKPGGKSRT